MANGSSPSGGSPPDGREGGSLPGPRGRQPPQSASSADSSPGGGASGRERTCIVTRQALPEAKLIRFVAGPDGEVVPDLARKLPGRGLWVEAQRGAIEQAARKGAFARAAKVPLKAPPDLADRVAELLKARVLNGLGLARRAGELTWGFEKVGAAIQGGSAAWLVEAADGAQDGRRKILQIARRQPRPPRLFGVFSSAELGLALGLENVIHLAFLAGRGAERWTSDVERLSGFRPLLPESWREEPQDGAEG